MAFAKKQFELIGSIASKFSKSLGRIKTVTLMERYDVKQEDQLLRITTNDDLIILLQIDNACTVYRQWDGSLAVLKDVRLKQRRPHVILRNPLDPSNGSIVMTLRYAVAVDNYENRKLKLSRYDPLLILATQSDRTSIGINKDEKLCVVPTSVINFITKPRLFIENDMHLSMSTTTGYGSIDITKVPNKLLEFNVSGHERFSVVLHPYKESSESTGYDNAVLIPECGPIEEIRGARAAMDLPLPPTTTNSEDYYSWVPPSIPTVHMRPSYFSAISGISFLENAEQYKVITDYTKKEEDEVDLITGDIVNVLEKRNDWWLVSTNGSQGLVPSMCLTKTETEDDVYLPTGGWIQAGQYIAMYDYTKEDEDEVELKEGDTVEVFKSVTDGWCQVRVNGNRGLAPSNYLAKMYEDDDSKTVEDDDATDGWIQAGQYIAMYDYTREDEDEVEFKEGDTVEVFKSVTDGWCQVRVNGHRGLAPSNYLAKMYEDNVRKSVQDDDDGSHESVDENKSSKVRKGSEYDLPKDQIHPEAQEPSSYDEKGSEYDLPKDQIHPEPQEPSSYDEVKLLISNENCLTEEKWFHGRMTRGQAESVLEHEGDYLFRLGSSNSIVLSYCLAENSYLHCENLPFEQGHGRNPEEIRNAIIAFMNLDHFVGAPEQLIRFLRTPSKLYGKIDRTSPKVTPRATKAGKDSTILTEKRSGYVLLKDLSHSDAATPLFEKPPDVCRGAGATAENNQHASGGDGARDTLEDCYHGHMSRTESECLLHAEGDFLFRWSDRLNAVVFSYCIKERLHLHAMVDQSFGEEWTPTPEEIKHRIERFMSQTRVISEYNHLIQFKRTPLKQPPIYVDVPAMLEAKPDTKDTYGTYNPFSPAEKNPTTEQDMIRRARAMTFLREYGHKEMKPDWEEIVAEHLEEGKLDKFGKLLEVPMNHRQRIYDKGEDVVSTIRELLQTWHNRQGSGATLGALLDFLIETDPEELTLLLERIRENIEVDNMYASIKD